MVFTKESERYLQRRAKSIHNDEMRRINNIEGERGGERETNPPRIS